MARRKTIYRKQAITLEQQIERLRMKGVVVEDENKARECLADIGYYRLGFYTHSFELTYPLLDGRRRHQVRPGTTLGEIVALYYFDFDLRNILNKYLSRIEVAIRTTIIYELSIKYISNPTWFADGDVVSEGFISGFRRAVYGSIRSRPVIQRHHGKYLGEYAPAWKTMEFMTFGNLEALYGSLLNDADKRLVSNHFHEPAVQTFKSYLSAVREVRNACAHGNVLFDMTLTFGIRSGRACSSFPHHSQQSFAGAIRVIDFLLRQISANRANDMWQEMQDAASSLYSKAPSLQSMIEELTGIIGSCKGEVVE